MDRLHAMQVFVRVSRLGSFAAAARELQLSNTATSRVVSQLEAHLGVRLLRRTTRQVSLTDEGAAYLRRCERILADIQELEEGLAEGQRTPRGRLRISAGVSFAQEQLNALMPEFLERYPELEVEALLTDRHIDLVAEGVDVAVRIGRLPDSTLIAKRIAPCRHVVCASPRYVAKRGLAQTPSALAEHACIIDTNQPRNWHFDGPGGPETFAATGRYRVNSAHAARDAAIAGLGIAYLPTFVAGTELVHGALVRQMPDYRAAETAMYAVYPENRYLSAGVTAFIRMLAERFQRDPPWDCWLRPNSST